ncbi:MAG TPA: bifunctional nuclease family protein, partial [Gemmatimonadaceae bacterium]|nr:bifunctional nuclease family protein [Gemmatimonadaceae bacterium]
MQLVEVEVMRLGLDRSTNSYVVILQEKGGARLLPIWIGQPEAESIVIEMNKLKRERPLTHDLCKNLIIGLGGTLSRVNITKVENRTFYAELHIARTAGAVHIDARPSDSIAIALRFEAPIFAQETLLTALLLEEGQNGDRVVVEDHSVLRRNAIVSAKAWSVASGSKRGPTSRPKACSASNSTQRNVGPPSSASRIVSRAGCGVCGSRRP